MGILSWGRSGRSRPNTSTLPSSTSSMRLLVTHLHRLGLAAAALRIEVVFADALTFERRAEVHRDVDLGDLDLEAPDFDGLLPQLRHGHVADYVLIGADTGGQHLGDVLVGDGREAPVDTTRGVGVPFVGDLGYGMTNAKMRSLLYRSIFRAAPGLTPPKAMAARLAKPRAKTAPEMSGLKGTIRVGQPICTPPSRSCSVPRSCRQWTWRRRRCRGSSSDIP